MDLDLLIRGGHVVDPANQIDGIRDVAIRAGRVVNVAANLPTSGAAQILDATGRYVIPGFVDIHVHASTEFNGRAAHRMLASAGVTTALDLAGPIGDVLTLARDYGAGINLACINRLKPGEMIPTANATRAEVRQAVDASLSAGALGVKVLGGHFPLSPETTAHAIAEANRAGAYVAFHCGTTATGSDMTGLREALELMENHRLHVPHINSYCRGVVDDVKEEAREAADLVARTPGVFSESYLATINGTWAYCAEGVPESNRTKAALKERGYSATEEGLRQAIMAGWAQIHHVVGGHTELLVGSEGVRVWEQAGTNVGVSFAVNPPLPRVYLATVKDTQGRFMVDALATDGGGIPRNVLGTMGMRLVQLEMITMAELVTKAAQVPARTMGLWDKGHLGVGADADVAILDRESGAAHTTICGGRIVMHEGAVLGRGTTVITTARGRQAVEAMGLPAVVTDLTQSAFYGAA